MAAVTSDIDEGLYSRQLYVLGADSMKKMSQSNILICGMGGLGVEMAKNIILSGVKSVTLFDPKPVTMADLSTNFYCTKDHIGAANVMRAKACKNQLAELNNYVPTSILEAAKLQKDHLAQIQVVVLTDSGLAETQQVAAWCRELHVKLVVAQTAGLCGQIFCDFGPEFVVNDTTGEEPLCVMVQAIEQAENATVMCLEETRHGFEDGDHVTFTEVVGMTELNNCVPRKIKVLGPDAFSIGDTRGLTPYISGGMCVQVKMPKTIKFKDFKTALTEPEFLISDFAKFERPAQLHLLFQALDAFRQAHGGSNPRPWCPEDAADLIAHAGRINGGLTGQAKVDTVNETLARHFAFTAAGATVGMQAVIGSIAAQEVLKACSGKFQPIQQWFYFDAFECLPGGARFPPEPALSPADTQPGADSGRHEAQIAIFGRQFQRKMANQRFFLVGAGAIGCEMLKNFALLGLGSGEKGRVFVTDMDTIERSNLNRQFLFRNKDIGRMKSNVAAAATLAINPEMHVEAHENRVGEDTENIYTEEFWAALNGVTNALDNVEARRYVDRVCVFHRLPLLESGTLGTKGNVQVVLPYLTESYSSSNDPPERAFPFCTLKNFPYQIEHTLQWARDAFEGLFTQTSQSVVSYMQNSEEFLKNVYAQSGQQPVDMLETLQATLDSYPRSFEACVQWARHLFQDRYHNTIAQLLHNFPADNRTSSGALFWSGTKRCPRPLVFNPNDKEHLDFVVSAANIRAHMFGLRYNENREHIRQVAVDTVVEVFKPREGVRIAVTDAEMNAMMSAGSDLDKMKQIAAKLPTAEKLRADGLEVSVEEFEKDDDCNFHIDFITAASNLRAANYSIAPADRLKSKLIAGRIIPAIATTTSLVAGLVSLELIKVVQGHAKLDDFKNGFVNLALPFFGFSEPIAPARTKVYGQEFSLWDRYDLSGDMTLQQFLDHFKKDKKLDITMLSHGSAILYSFFCDAAKVKQRMPMKMSALIEMITKKPIPSHVRCLVLDMCCNDDTGEDVDVPYVKLTFR